ncbi:MAG: hypothetical protein ACOY90_18555 [Candidatus Zhuqueibacterota bacterium]
MNKFINKALIFFPFFIVCVVSYLKWVLANKSILIFLVASGICFILGSFLVLYSRLKYKAEIKSLGATMLSILTMQKIAGFSLVIVAIVAFTWLMDYVREFPALEQSPNFLLAGAIFSFSLMFIVLGVVNFTEKQKIEQLISPNQGVPRKTKGLVLSLSVLSKKEKINKFIRLINSEKVILSKVRAILQEILKYTTPEKRLDMNSILKPEIYTLKAIEAFRLLMETPLYPPLLAMEHHRNNLEQIWVLLTSEAEETSLQPFETIINFLYKKIKITKVEINDPDDVNRICKTVDDIYIRAKSLSNLDEEDITADITSGPATATAGIVLACVRSKRQVQYLGRRSMNLQSIEVNVRSIPNLFDELMEQIRIYQAAKAENKI